jgi:hypothetical protein
MDDFFDMDEFIIDPDEIAPVDEMELWDTGQSQDLFSSGEPQDIFTAS